MARPGVFAAIRDDVDEDVETEKERARLGELLVRYHELLVLDGVTPARALARVKQWLRMGAGIDPALVPLFDLIKGQAAWDVVRPMLGSPHVGGVPREAVDDAQDQRDDQGDQEDQEEDAGDARGGA
jgi:hypothetical protein